MSKENVLYRSLDIGEIDEESRTVNLSFSSEEPYLRGFGYEILGHGEGEVDMARLANKAPFLLDHDWEKQVGVVEKSWIEGGKGKAVVRFSKNPGPSEVFQDIVDGIRSKISVGYFVNKMERVGDMNDEAAYRVKSWLPFELSLVAVPADDTVGIGRAAEQAFDVRQFEPIDTEVKKEIKQEAQKMSEEVKEVKTPEIDVKSIQEKARKEELNRVREIQAIGDKHNMKEIARKAIEDGEPVDSFRIKVLESIGDIKPVDPKATEIGMSEKEKKNFSLFRAINAIAKGDFKGLAPLEYEASKATEQKLGKSAQGFFLPADVAGYRDITVGSPASPSTGGGNLVATDLFAQSFIGLLRSKMVLTEMGATFLDGLQGDVAIPKAASASTAYWVAENNAVTESTPTFGQVTMNPKTVGTYVDLSRHFIKQSSLDAEMLVRNDMADQIARAIEYVAMYGGGTNQPTGILKTSGIGDVAVGGVPTYANILELWSDVAGSNADIGALGFVTHAAIAAKLMAVFTNSTYGERSVWMNGAANGEMIGFPARVTNNLPTNIPGDSGTTGLGNYPVIFGNWADLLIGSWSGIDVNVDTASLSTQGAVRVVCLTDVDVAVRHAASFSAIQDARTS